MAVNSKEEATAASTRVFSWNEILLPRSKHLDRLGLFTLTTQNHITKIFPGKPDVIEEPPKIRTVIPFHLHHLECRDSFQPMLCDLLSSTEQFVPESAHSLSSQIASYLFSHYRFHSKPPGTPVKGPLTVVAVHVERARVVEFSSEDEEDVDGSSLILHPEDSSSSDECYSDWEPDIWKGKNDPNLKYTPELIVLTDVMKRYLGVRNKIPTKPIVSDKPVGLVEVKPQPGLEIVMFQQGDHGRLLQDKTCWICLKEFSDGMELAKTACSHVFHGNCVFRWLFRDNSCPICRFLLFKD